MCPPPPRYFRKRLKGFTLAELLICLVILAEIATFTIPKILTSQTNTQNNARAKEVASMISAAYQQYSLNNTLSSGTTSGLLTQYMNYVKVDSTTIIDNIPVYSTLDCSNASFTCLKLHSGGILVMRPTENFGGTNTTNGVYFMLDPDGQLSTNKSVSFLLLYNGRITSNGACDATITSSQFTYTCSSAKDPSWFSW